MKHLIRNMKIAIIGLLCTFFIHPFAWAQPSQPPIYNITAPSLSISEEKNQSATFTITLSGDVLGNNQTSTIQLTLEGTAEIGNDYSDIWTEVAAAANNMDGVTFDSDSKQLTFKGSNQYDLGNEFTFTVKAIDDTIEDDAETIIITLSSVEDATMGDSSSATATINDLDPISTYSIAASAASISEEDNATVTFTITLDGGLTGSETSSLTIGLDGTAESGADYDNFWTAISNAADGTTGVTFSGSTLTFDADFGSGDFTFSVNAIDDANVEGPETIIAYLSSTPDGIISASASATTEITETDVPSPVFEITSTPSIFEKSGATASFNIILSEDPLYGEYTSAVTLTLSGTATSGSDYDNFWNAVSDAAGASAGVTFDGTNTLTFDAAFNGEGIGDFTFTVDAIVDEEAEDPETITVTLSNPINGSLGTLSSSTTSISEPVIEEVNYGDTCIFFQEPTDETKPRIMLLFDTGAEMEQIVWHEDYNKDIDYSPVKDTTDEPEEIVGNTDGTPVAGGNGFYNKNGYAIDGCKIVKILDDQSVDTSNDAVYLSPSLSCQSDNDGSGREYGKWTINGKTVLLPAAPGDQNDTFNADDEYQAANSFPTGKIGVMDYADHFRYSANYLNWIFFSGQYLKKNEDGTVVKKDDGTDAPGDGSDFKAFTRLYYSKKAMFEVARRLLNRAEVGYWYFGTGGPTSAQPLKELIGGKLDADGNVVSGIDADEPDNNVLISECENNINGIKPAATPFSPLALGLAEIANAYKDTDEYCQKSYIIAISPGVPSMDDTVSNQSIPSQFKDWDQDGDDSGSGLNAGFLSGEDNDIPLDTNGSSYMDDIADYLFTHDIFGGEDENDPDSAQYDPDSPTFGTQNINTYTVGFMGDEKSKKFLINTSNNGNGNRNLYDTNDPDYGKYHYEAASPDDLADAIIDAINDILNKTSSFTAPVVPVTRTTSGNDIYLSFFKPSSGAFWEGNVAKYKINTDVHYKLTEDALNGLNSETYDTGNVDPVTGKPIYEATIPPEVMTKLRILQDRDYTTQDAFVDDLTSDVEDGGAGLTDAELAMYKSLIMYYADFGTMQIVDKNNNPATWPNGAMKDDAIPYWQTKDWSNSDADNQIDYDERKIYTWLEGFSGNYLSSYSSNEFDTANTALKAIYFGVLLKYTREDVINYIRGADILDEDKDGVKEENRAIITGDILHSEPAVLQYYDSTTVKKVVFFGANDGMLHAVDDDNGNEMWAFIPPDLIHRLKELLESKSHKEFVDLSPKLYLKDENSDGIVGGSDQAILVCGERNGGAVYFALDVTAPADPKFLWRISSYDESWSCLDDDPPCTGAEVYKLPEASAPTAVYPELAKTWSEPRFGTVATADPTVDATTGEKTFGSTEDVMFIGAGYSDDNAEGNPGKGVIVLDVDDGSLVRKFISDEYSQGVDSKITYVTDMDYSIPAQIAIVDENDNGIIDKFYVGDTGGQLWRFGKFTDSSDPPLPLDFPETNENITEWKAFKLFETQPYRKFFYRANVTLDEGFDAIFIGTGDRNNACDDGALFDDNGQLTGYYRNRVYMIKDVHGSKPIKDYRTVDGVEVDADLVNITDITAPAPNLKSPPLGYDSDSAIDHTNPIDDGTYDTTEWNEMDVDGNGLADWGWYVNLAQSEKVLADGVLFAEALYITTFTLNDDPCQPGGTGTLYGFDYLTAQAVLNFDDDETTGINSDRGNGLDRSTSLGGGIPSKPVLVIPDSGEMKLFISIGSAQGDDDSLSTEAGIIAIDPLAPDLNFYFRWWKDY